MNFMLDENIPKRVTAFLLSKGHRVFDVRGTHREGMTDSEIFVVAQESDSVFLTTDRDFHHTIPFLFSHHCGILIISLRQPNGARILEKIAAALPLIESLDISNSCLLLTDTKVTLSKRSAP